MFGISVAERARTAGAESSNSGLIVIFVCFCVYFLTVAAGRRPICRDVKTKKRKRYTNASISLISVYRAGLTLPDSDANILFFCKEQKTTDKQ